MKECQVCRKSLTSRDHSLRVTVQRDVFFEMHFWLCEKHYEELRQWAEGKTVLHR